jgi:outer membrane protein TolC
VFRRLRLVAPAPGAVVLGVALMLTGCAAYRPSPLQPEALQALAPPDQAALARAAAALRHPRLQPMVIDFGHPLTPEALGVIAVLASPDLKAARAQAGVADAQVFSAGLMPDPQFTFNWDHTVAAPGPGYIDALTSQLALDLAALRDRKVSLQIARAAREQVRLDIAWQEWQTAGQARLLAARIAGLRQSVDLDRRSEAIAREELDRVLAAASRGDLKADDVQARRLASADASDRLRQAERDLRAAQQDLNRILGLAPDQAIDIAAEAPRPPSMDTASLFEQARASRLDLLALQAGYESQEATVRKAVLDQFPTFDLGLTAARDNGNVRSLGPNVAFTVPLWNRNRGGIAVERATREQLRAEYAARVFATRADIAALVSALDIGARQRDELAAQVGPLSRNADAAEAAADRGDLAVSAAHAVRQSLLDKQISLAGLNQSLSEQAIGLEIAVGAAVQEGAS